MVERWDVITIGNLSRNRYWGEDDSAARRSPLCTSTLISGPGYRLLVDPPLRERDAMADMLDRRMGLTLDAITHVFITHHHGDHLFGLPHFMSVPWLASEGLAARLNAGGELAKPVESAVGRLPDGVEALPTPGHTLDHEALRFESDGAVVVVAGDAVMTLDFWRDRQGYFNSEDLAQVAGTMDQIAAVADIVVPGHDNAFLVRPPRG